MGKKSKSNDTNEGIRKVNVTWVLSAVLCVSILFLFISSKLTVKEQQYIPPHLLPKKNPAAMVKPEPKVRGYRVNY